MVKTIIIGLLCLILGGIGGYLISQKKNKTVTKRDIMKVLKNADRDEEQIESLAQLVRDNSFQLFESVLNLIEHPNEDIAHGARFLMGELIINDIENLMFLPIGKNEHPKKPLDRWLVIQILEDAERSLRKGIFHKIYSLLDDKRLIPFPPPMGPIEEIPEPQRVCDEAFWSLKRLLAPINDDKETLGQLGLDEGDYLELDFEERDKIIKKGRQSQLWRDLAPE